jgi:putative salt-induced outer membrane protein YdiY
MKRFQLYLTAILLCTTAAQAEEPATGCPPCPTCPTCAEDEPKDPSVWDKSIIVGYGLSDGNSNTQTITGNAKLARDYEDNIWNFEVGGGYGESDSDDSNVKEQNRGDVIAKASYKRLLSKRFYLGTGLDFLHDDIADVSYRFTLSPNAGVFIVREEKIKLSLEAGPGYVWEEVDEIKDDYLAPRIANKFEWKFSETGKIFQTAEYLMDVDDSDNYLVKSELGIESALTSMFSLVVSVKNDYDNQPAVDKERSDTIVGASLKVNL